MLSERHAQANVEVPGLVAPRVDLPLLGLPAVDRERDLHRRRAVGADPSEPRAEVVVRLDREAVPDPDRSGGLELLGLVALDHRPDRRVEHDRAAGDLLGGGQVLLHQDGRERQHVADAVETVAGIVGGKIVGRPEIDRQEVPDRVVVLKTVQTPRRDAPRVRQAVADAKRRLDPARHGVDVGARRRGPPRRRHLSRPQLLEDLLPHLPARKGRGSVVERFEVEAGRLHLPVMAGGAVAGQKRLHDPVEVRRGLARLLRSGHAGEKRENCKRDCQPENATNHCENCFLCRQHFQL